jgi:GIY-YIG catalytic domain
LDIEVGTDRELPETGNTAMSDFRVKETFKQTRQGKSPEYIICDSTLNEKFLAAARQLGVVGSDAIINRELLNLRKENRLKDCPTTSRKRPDPNRRDYLNRVLNAVRMTEKQFRSNVDDIICNPEHRAQFDALVQFMCPGIALFEAQYAALSLRKSNQLKSEPVGQVIRAVGSKILKLSDVENRFDELPIKPGIYIFFDESVTLYVGKAKSLRERIAEHISSWAYRELIRRMRSQRNFAAFLAYHELPVTISARELAAYEIELIRSRNPEHNRADNPHRPKGSK